MEAAQGQGRGRASIPSVDTTSSCQGSALALLKVLQTPSLDGITHVWMSQSLGMGDGTQSPDFSPPRGSEDGAKASNAQITWWVGLPTSPHHKAMQEPLLDSPH